LHTSKITVLKKLFQFVQEGKELQEPVLNIRLGEKNLSYAISDQSAGSLSGFQYYQYEHITPEELDNFWADHADLKQNFIRINFCIDNPGMIQVPVSLVSQESKETCLENLVPVMQPGKMISKQLAETDTEVVYHLPDFIRDRINNYYPVVNFQHVGFTLMQAALREEASTLLMADFSNGYFWLVAKKDNELLLCCTHNYKEPFDVLYSLLSVYHKYNLTTAETPLKISGLIEKQSALYTELYKYFTNIEFRTTNWSSEDADCPPHFFTSLNDIALCAS